MQKRWKWLTAGGAVLVVGGVVAAFVQQRFPLDEAAELAVQGAEQKLRETLRPHAAGPRVLLFALDGVGRKELDALLEGAPPLRVPRLLGKRRDAGVFDHGYAAPDAVGILPTTTIAAWSSIYTGQPAARNGVPGNEWFVREERRFFAPVPVSVKGRADTLHMLTDGLVGNALRTPTLFDLADVRAYVSLAPVYRGADIFTSPAPSALADLFGEVAKGWTEGDMQRESYSEVDEESVEALLTTLAQQGIPRLQVVYFPGVDLFSHVAETPLEDQKRYLREVLDPLIGAVLKAYESKGVLGDTHVLFVSDHGHTPVLHDDRHALSVEGEDEPPALIEQVGFRLRPFELTTDAEDFQAVLAYQGAMAYVYLADRSTCPQPKSPCNWKLAPRFEHDVLPLLRAFHAVNTTGKPIAALRATLDLIFSREPRGVGQDALPFQIFDGERLLPVAEYLNAHPRPDLLDLEARLAGLAAGPHGNRAGDILLLAKSGLERPIDDRFYFSHPYSSWHGSPTAQDSHVPLVVARQGADGAELARIVRDVTGAAPSQLHVVPLVLRLLGK